MGSKELNCTAILRWTLKDDLDHNCNSSYQTLDLTSWITTLSILSQGCHILPNKFGNIKSVDYQMWCFIFSILYIITYEFLCMHCGTTCKIAANPEKNLEMWIKTIQWAKYETPRFLINTIYVMYEHC